MNGTTGFRRGFAGPPREGDAVGIALSGLFARLLIVYWAASRFPPAADGHFYQVVATRIAQGLGYTWLWPDGAVTYAAHYPVGYPAILGALYAVFGDATVVAMVFNAMLGAFAVWAAHHVAASVATRGGALLAAGLVAFHPALVFYTPALMTEGVAGSILMIASWLVVRARSGRQPLRTSAVIGVVMGVLSLVRPQLLLLSPIFGALAGFSRGRRHAILSCGLVTGIAVCCCLPWTLRNCVRMERCVFVSANAGWNLLIGTAERADGGFLSIDEIGVPPSCRAVFGEADKDACFRAAATEKIREAPLAWLALVPAKLAMTFDYGGAAGWYLHESNPRSFDARDKWILGAVETILQRLALLAALVALFRVPGPLARVRRFVSAAAGVFVFQRSAWVAYAGIVVAGATLGHTLRRHPPAALCCASLLVTAAVHAVFFGAGRYSLVCYPLLSALAGAALTRADPAGDTAKVVACIDR